MKNKTYFLSTILAVCLAVFMLAAVLVRAFLPAFILPKPELPNVVLVSLIALVINHYVAKDTKPCYVCVAIFAVLSFGLLPFAAGYVAGVEAIKLAVVGGLTFTVLTFLFTSIQDRIATGPARAVSPIISALCLYLASQGLMGMIL